MQGKRGHSSPELRDTCRHSETNVKDCKAGARTAAQIWETSVKNCQAEADTAAQSWVTKVKNCEAEVDTAV